ncbi:flagellar basal-body rod protein FlgF [Acidobacteria bacterium AB60]|nr:flagellar basal-body rod protein FlgF [Acidobacteria bacterium AB60]
MDSGFYAACTALMSRTQALDAIANNLANAGTTGYRAQRDVFNSVLAAASDAPISALNRAANDYGILTGTRLDLTQGALEKTGNPLDMAVEGPGFFTVQTANGTFYTRNGAFQVSAKGQLVTASGDPVLGDRGPISLMDGSVTISPDGTISSAGAVAGKLKIVDFPPGTALESVGNSYYSAPSSSEGVANQFNIRQGMLESSNVNPVAGMVELITVQRSAEMMQRALSMFSSEMDKTATQDLPKVG